MKNNIEKTFDVFISYSRADRMIAEGVCGYLESKKIRCFIDYRDIPKGMNWSNVIPNAIRKSCLMLAIFSKEFNSSEQTDSEITIAANRNVPILVFRITDDDFDGTKEYYLTKSNWIEAFPQPEKFFGELFKNICILLGIDNTKQVAESKLVQTQELPLDNGGELVQTGLDILKNSDGDREMAVYYFRKAAKEGDSQGEYLLGKSYYEGLGIPNDYQSAKKWFELSMEHGNAYAMEKLAKMYHYGIGIEKDMMKAMQLYTKAADAGNGIAMKELGKAFHTGDLGVQNEERSVKYFGLAFDELYEKAMGKNDGMAQYELGRSYFEGVGVRKNYSQAVKFFLRAMKNHNADAYNAMGLCYQTGLGVKENAQKSFELQLKGAELGSPCAMYNTAQNYYLGNGTEPDVEKYKKWVHMAADAGYVAAQESIGHDYWVGENCEQNIDLARKWFEKAVVGGSLRALAYLGTLYVSGDIIVEDGKEKAFLFYKRAAVGGYISSFVALANCYFDGIGTKINYEEAARWYLKATEIYENMTKNNEQFFYEPIGCGISELTLFANTKLLIFATAFKNLAWLYRNGKGVEQNLELADYWKNRSRAIKKQSGNLQDEEEAIEENFPVVQNDEILAKNKVEQEKKVEAPKELHIVRGADNTYGYANSYDEVVIGCQWTKVSEFKDGMAFVWNGTKMGMIDENGIYYFEPKISCKEAERIGPRLIKTRDSLYSLYTLDGNSVSSDMYEELGSEFIDGYLPAVKFRIFGKNQVGKIDIRGRFFENLIDEKGKSSVVRKDVRQEGEEKAFKELHVVRGADNVYGYANSHNEVVISCQWTKVSEFKDGIAFVWNGTKMGVIDENGTYYFEPKIDCTEAEYIGYRLIKTKDSSFYKLYTLDGNVATYDLFEELGSEFVDGYLPAVRYRMFGKNRVGKVDTTGKFFED